MNSVTTNVNESYGIIRDANNPNIITHVHNTSGSNNYVLQYGYDSYGNVTSESLSNASGTGTTSIQSSTTYSTTAASFGAVHTQTDAAGSTVTYFYNSKGQLIGVCDENGDGLVYQYDGYGRLIGAQAASCNTAGTAMTALTSGSAVSYSYNTKGWLGSVSNGNVSYQFTYDDFGNTEKVSIGSNMLSSYDYGSNDGNLQRQDYGNGFYVCYEYDNIDRVTGICYNGVSEATFTYVYNANGLISKHIDNTNGVVHRYDYDTSDRLVRSTMHDESTNELLYLQQVEYDAYGRLASQYHYFPDAPGDAPSLSGADYTYEENTNYLAKINHWGTSTNVRYTYDAYGRVSQKRLTNNYDSAPTSYITQNYTYQTSGTADYNRLGSVATIAKESNTSTTRNITYTYDALGNINAMMATVAGENLFFVTYDYDAKSQLVREDFRLYENESKSFTKTYTYDNAGNLLYTRQYAYTLGDLTGTYTQTNYTYGNASWKDQLTAFNDKAITYDAIGNPLTYDGATFTWQGRRLVGYTNNYDVVTYEYNADGIRTAKTVNGVRHEYYLNGSQIIREVIYDSDGSYIEQDLRYFYDGEGKPTAIRYFSYTATGAVSSDITYYLITNAQGDVTGICDAAGNLLYTYVYDAWGNLLQGKQIASGGAIAVSINPFRYRGYYFDIETGYYYLNSRYYNPEWGRFLNADSVDILTATPGALTDKNLYAYCDNNPVMRADDSGEFWHVVAGAAIGGLIGGISSIVGQVVVGQKINWAEVGVSAVSGALTGAITAACPGMGAVATGIVHGVVGAGTHVATELVNGRTPTVVGTLTTGVISGVLAGGAKALGNIATKTSSKITQSVGVPFDGMRTSQIGVDPNTLKLNPNFTPNPAKYNAALQQIKANGMYGVIDVQRSGMVINGQHRVLIARQLGIAVDIAIQ